MELLKPATEEIGGFNFWKTLNFYCIQFKRYNKSFLIICTTEKYEGFNWFESYLWLESPNFLLFSIKTVTTSNIFLYISDQNFLFYLFKILTAIATHALDEILVFIWFSHKSLLENSDILWLLSQNDYLSIYISIYFFLNLSKF